MTSAEIVEAMKERVPVILDHPFHGVLIYARIAEVRYKPTVDFFAPASTRDGVTVSVLLADRCGYSVTLADPKYVHRYTGAEYEKRRREREVLK